jgi:hypothetical protein
MRWRNSTVSPRIGSLRAHITITYNADGRPIAIACSTASVGSALRTHHEAIAGLASLALRHGAPVADVAEQLAEVVSDPRGDVYDHDSIKSAQSLADLMGQVLLAGGVS